MAFPSRSKLAVIRRSVPQVALQHGAPHTHADDAVPIAHEVRSLCIQGSDSISGLSQYRSILIRPSSTSKCLRANSSATSSFVRMISPTNSPSSYAQDEYTSRNPPPHHQVDRNDPAGLDFYFDVDG